MTDFRPLHEVCEFSYGKALRQDRRVAGDVPVYGSNGIVGWHNEAITAGPTIVIGRKGSIGKVAWSDRPCYPIDTTYYVDQTKVPTDLKWLYYALTAIDLTRLNMSAAVPGLNREDAGKQLVPQLSVRDQERIADRLDAAAEHTQLRQYGLELGSSLTGATFSLFFGSYDEAGSRWPLGPLAELGTLDRGRSRNRPRNAPHLYGGPYPFIQTGDVANSDGYVLSHTQTYSDAGLAQSKLWPVNTLCITIAANIGKTAILTYPACFPDSIVGFAPGPSVTIEFVQAWLAVVQQRLEITAPEAAQKNINLEILRQLVCPRPPIDRQERFSEIVRTHNLVVAQQREAVRQADDLFDALLAASIKNAA